MQAFIVDACMQLCMYGDVFSHVCIHVVSAFVSVVWREETVAVEVKGGMGDRKERDIGEL